MNTLKVAARFISSLLSILMAVSGLSVPIKAQSTSSPVRRVIIVNADQPNVWTLEQAHYLLAQMHRRNLDLRAKKLEDLDPNEINGLRFDVLRQLIEFGATFNQADQLTNQILKEDKTTNAERRRSLTAHRDKLHDDSLVLTHELSQLKIEKAKATAQEDKDRLDAEIAAKTTEQAKVDKEIEFDDNELKTLGGSSGNFEETTGGATFDEKKLPKSTFDDAFKAAVTQQIAEFNKAPKLNATLRLENFLQMQYEIIAKQLTLLRDEVGPGERLLFLEMPQTVNVAHHEADKKWAQSWWRISGYFRNCEEYNRDLPKALLSTLEPCKGEATKKLSIEKLNNSTEKLDDRDTDKGRKQKPPPEPISRRTERIWNSWNEISQTERVTDLKNGYGDSYVNLQLGKKVASLDFNDREVRTVELIPRQSSLNVNDMKLRSRAGAFNFALTTLFGFGSSLNVQRQREQFSQFVQQELYSSAFGKGSREFGWTFTAMPGTDRLMSGVRTTYAVVVVPNDASYLVMEANGCYFPKSQYEPNDFDDTRSNEWTNVGTSRNCGVPKAFLVPVPVGANGQNDFYVTGLTYQPVPKGERLVVTAYGYNFSSQVGVLINGSPLTQSIGLGQPLLLDDSAAGTEAAKLLKDEKVHGRIERVDSEQIVFSFEMPPDYQGTPAITLIAPGKAVTLNQLDDLYINGVIGSSLTDHNAGRPVSETMFGREPAPSKFKIDPSKLEIFPTGPGKLSVLIKGQGFDLPKGRDATCELFVNGVTQPCRVVSASLMVSEFAAPLDEFVELTITNRQNTETLPPRVNPAFFKIESVSATSYQPPSGRTPGAMVVKITGSGFTTGLRSTVGKLVVASTTEATLTIFNPPATVRVTLFDSRLGASYPTVIRRPPPN